MKKIYHLLASTLIFLCIVVPAILASLFVVPVLLLTKWDGRTTIFGNSKWGRASNHPYNATFGYLSEFNWLVLRNPVYNLGRHYLCAKGVSYKITGDTEIGDKIAGGSYVARMGRYWEYYTIIPYTFFGKKCVRVRIGWKLHRSDYPAAFCFVINPWMPYRGK